MSSPKGIPLVTLIVVLTLHSARAEGPAVDAIAVQPAEIVLQGSRATQRVLVSGRLQASLESDLSALAHFESLDPAVATVTPDGVVSPAPASLAFTLLPPYWQRWWFVLFVGAAAAAQPVPSLCHTPLPPTAQISVALSAHIRNRSSSGWVVVHDVPSKWKKP